MANRWRRGRGSLILCGLLFLLGAPAAARGAPEERAMLLPESLALSPDGRLLICSWRGDLWGVRRVESGRNAPARRLTFHPAEDRRPQVSPDGRLIAFTSDRTGTEQVYVMPMGGGEPRQITHHSEASRAYGWFPDSKAVLVRSARDHAWRRAERLFRQPLEEGASPELLFDAECGWSAVSPSGGKIAFTRGGRAWWRKGYRGSSAAQLWLYHVADERFERLSTGDHGELWPMWGADDDTLFYVSEQSGTWNVWRRDLGAGTATPLTKLQEDGASYACISADGSTIAFRRLGAVLAVDTSGRRRPERVAMHVAGDPTVERIQRDTVQKASDAAFSDDGREILFIAGGDVWVMDTELREPRQITNTPQEERDPVFGPDFQAVYFISDAAGHTDIWKAERAEADKHWWQNEHFVAHRVTDDEDVEADLSITPDGEHLAYLRGHGDLWIRPRAGGAPRRLVASFMDVSYSFSPDGRWVAYARADNDFNSDIWIQKTDGTGEPVNVSVHPDNDRNPAWSPDGKVLAFTGRRWTEESDICYVWLRKRDAETDSRARKLEKALEKMKGRKKGASKSAKKPAAKPGPAAKAPALAGTWTGSLKGPPPLPADGVGLEITVEKDEGGWTGRMEVVDQFEGAFERLTFEEGTGAFAFALTTPLGPLEGEGTAAADALRGTWKIPDVMEGTFEASRKREAPAQPAAVEAGKKGKEDKAPQPVEVDLEGIADRVQRVSIPDASESGLLWSPDSKILAFRATIEGDAGLYGVAFPEPKKPVLITKTRIRARRWLEAGQQITGLAGGVPASLTSARRKGEPISLGKGVSQTSLPFSLRQEVSVAARNAAAFEQAWRVMRDTFYDERLNNRDWEAVKAKYMPLAEQALTPFELETVVNLMLGELNGSHLGFRATGGGWHASGWQDVTGHLGVLWDADWEGPGLRVGDVIRGSPADEDRHRIEAGDVVLSIDARPVEPGTDVDRLLTGDPARIVTVHVRDPEGKERTLRMRPSSYPAIRRLLYDHELDKRRARVSEASDGRLGYLHVRGMNWSSFLRFEAELFKVGHGKDGLVIDVRDNGGGFTTDHLLTCLTQPRHAITVPRGGGPGYPQDRMVYAPWHKPIVVLCNQNSFSNAEIFSHAIKQLGRGQLVGVRTAGGVISTGATSIMGLGTLRLPFRGWFLATTGQDMERNGCVPDHVLWPEPDDAARGIDRQLDKAIEVLRAEVAAEAAKPAPELVRASER